MKKEPVFAFPIRRSERGTPFGGLGHSPDEAFLATASRAAVAFRPCRADTPRSKRPRSREFPHRAADSGYGLLMAQGREIRGR